jgi:hypothetical protein
MNNKNSVSSRARTTFRMQHGKIFSVTLIFAGLLFILGIASPARAEDPTKTCRNANQQIVPCPTKKPDNTSTPTPSPTPIPPPTLTCNARPKAGVAPLTVNFDSAPAGGTGTYGFYWVFGPPGATSSLQNPTFIYPDPGTYNAVVRVTSPPQDPTNPQPGTFADCRIIITVFEPTPIPAPTATPLFGLQLPNAGNGPLSNPGCGTWPISMYSGLGLALAGILTNLFRSGPGYGYIATHEFGHASLDYLDEYAESGFGRGLRILGFGLLSGGGLLAISGAAGNLGIFPCSWWPGAAGLGLGLLLTLSRLGKKPAKAIGLVDKLAESAEAGTKRAAEALEKKAESLNDKLPSFLDKKTVSGSFRETGESRTREIADVESETGAVMMESAQRAEEDLRDIQSRMESTGSEKKKIRDDNDESSAEDDEEKEN